MTLRKTQAALAAATLAFSTLGVTPALAQKVKGGSEGGAGSREVNASTYGYGSAETTPDGRAVNIGGGGEAYAGDGGTTETRSDARLNERRAMQRSTASARDEDERATSRTRTMVNPNDTVRSKTVSRYKQRGEKPVREMTYTVTRPDGTTETRTK